MNHRRRVLDIAKEHNISSKKALEIFQSLGVSLKSHFSTVSDLDYDRFIKILRNNIQSSPPSGGGASDRPNIKIRRRGPQEEKKSNAQDLVSSMDEDFIHSKEESSAEVHSDAAHKVTLPSTEHKEEHDTNDRVPSTHTEPSKSKTIHTSHSVSSLFSSDTVSDSSTTMSSSIENALQPQVKAKISSSRSSSAFRPATIIRKATQDEKDKILKRSIEMSKRPSGSEQPARRPFAPGGGTGQPKSASSSNRFHSQGERQSASGAYASQHRAQIQNSPMRLSKPMNWSSTTTPPAEDERKIKRLVNKTKDKQKSLESSPVPRKAPKKGVRSYLLDLQDEVEVFRKVKRPQKGKKEESTSSSTPSNTQKLLEINRPMSVSALAHEMSVKVAAVVKALMKLGVTATANQVLDLDTITLVAEDMGFQIKTNEVTLESILGLNNEAEKDYQRPPVVAVLGHVDHGKTSLLDYIRKSNVAASESGGITQKIGAYQVDYHGKTISFLDTPGHEAFTAMRARGAHLTDIAVIVVAADDGVMPQTKEAIAHAQAAGCPIIVAVNKIDKGNYNPDRIKAELVENGLQLEEWGGDVMVNFLSAKTGQGVPELLESILLQSELLDLKVSSQIPARGVVIEARLDCWRGPVATLMVQQGILRVSQRLIVGSVGGRVRSLHTFNGLSVQEAYPSQPIEVSGLDDVPVAGDLFYVVQNEDVAKEALSFLQENKQNAKLNVGLPKRLMPGSADDTRVLKVIVKADSQGTLEAIVASIRNLSTSKVMNQIIYQGVGLVTESDLMLAKTSEAIVVAFNTKLEKNAASILEREKLPFIESTIIYELNEKVQKAMLGELDAIKKEVSLGTAEVRNVFTISKMKVAGVMVLNGKVIRSASVRVKRGSEIILDSKVESLKRFKQEVKEVLQGFECGLTIHQYQDVQEGDLLEFYEWVEETPTVDSL